jgi:hypothetical protein
MLNSTISKLALIPVSAIFFSQVFISSVVSAEEEPFNLIQSTSNLILAEHHGGGHGMKKMDTNSDGEVSKDEFMTHEEMKFMMKDKNGDGKLTSDEMKHKKCKHGEKKNSS